MSAHTPAPWTASDNAIYGSNGLIKPLIAFLDDRFADEETANNARLIAAAPDALAALRNVIASYRANDPDSMANAVNDAEAAIAKATGEAA